MTLEYHEAQTPNGMLFPLGRHYVCGEFSANMEPFEIAGSFRYRDVADIHFLRIGAVALQYLQDGSLCPLKFDRTTGDGLVPAEVVDGQERAVDRQRNQVDFANFISALALGRYSAIARNGLTGLTKGTLNDFVICDVRDAVVVADSTALRRSFGPKWFAIKNHPDALLELGPSVMGKIFGFMAEVAELEQSARKADFKRCFLLNYEAALLHEQHQSAASVALSAAVAEQLVEELFYREGMVRGGRNASELHPDALSKTDFDKMKAAPRNAFLKKHSILNEFLYERLEQGRQTRNGVMHKGRSVSPRDAGDYLTALRDLWALFLSSEFSLISTHSYRL